jgi:two-component sensor histidine kinase
VLLHPYGDVEGADRRIVVTGDDEAIGKSATTSIALLINELATNALKYGSLSSPDGHVAVRVVRTAAATELVWQELGVGLTGPRTMSPTEGFGTTLMDNAVSRQLGGRLFREWGPEGLVVHVHLPLERLAR